MRLKECVTFIRSYLHIWSLFGLVLQRQAANALWEMKTNLKIKT